jgi:vacuolar-type H+-ATPase subunit E/Vma4
MTATIGHNNPPDPVETALAPFINMLAEAEHWLDGVPVEDEGQMAAVDDLLKSVKAAIKALSADKDSAAKPFHDQHKAELLRWKPALTDLDRIKVGLTAAVGAFKKRLADEKAEATRAACRAADEAKRAAEAATRAADASNIESVRAAAEMQEAASAAMATASDASRDKVRGLRTAHKFEINSYKGALNWIGTHDREAVLDFVLAYVAKHHRARDIAGVRTWEDKEAF